MRKTKMITIPGTPTEERGQRDNGKHFLITEMPADQAERWAMRALMAVADAGVDLPDAALGSGMAGIAVLGIRAIFRVPFAAAEPLMNEMMDCVQIVADLRKPFPRAPAGDDIEEVQTRLLLRSEVFELHTGFSVADAISESLVEMRSARTSESTPTSPSPSALSSAAA
jgi:hypothetical protein